jgi:hypothetical protein
MRKIILILFCIPLIGFAQENTELIQIQQEINMMKENLNSHHKQNRTGFSLVITGSISSIIGSTIITSPILVVGGAALSIVGSGIMFNSHKWFGKRRMKGHFIVGKRSDRHSLKKIYHNGEWWKIGDQVDWYVNDKYEKARIEDIILLTDDSIEFKIKLSTGDIVNGDWTDLSN